MTDQGGPSTQGAKENARASKSKNLEESGPAKDRIRDTIKWIFGVYGAIAAVFVAGASLAGLATPDTGGSRLWLAVIGLLVWPRM